MKDRWHDRVLANALGFVNSAFKPLRGVKRTAARGGFAGVVAVLLSLFSSSRVTREKKVIKPRTYKDGLYTRASKDNRPPAVRYKERYIQTVKETHEQR